MSVTFRFAASGEYRRIARFLDEYWSKNYVYTRMPDLFEWTFRRPGFWNQEGYSIALGEDKDEIVGILGGIPFVFNCFGQTSRALWLVNYLVRPDYRRGPIAIRLLTMFSRDKAEVKATSGLDPVLIPMFNALRWQVMMEFPRHFVILRGATDRAIHLLRMTHPDWQRERAESLVRVFKMSHLSENSERSVNCLPVNWDRDDWMNIASQTVGASRNIEYLKWRYLTHPCFNYRIIALGEGMRTGLAIWRLETIRIAVDGELKELDRIGRLVEFLPVSRTNARNLLAQLYSELYRADAVGADYYGYHGGSRAFLEENGFREVSSQPDGNEIPTRFQPLDGKGGGIVNAVLLSKEVPAFSADADSLWYWTKSEGDQDRPN